MQMPVFSYRRVRRYLENKTAFLHQKGGFCFWPKFSIEFPDIQEEYMFFEKYNLKNQLTSFIDLIGSVVIKNINHSIFSQPSIKITT